jgi:hypothetical protein
MKERYPLGKRYKCKRCGHLWLSRKKGKPLVCGKCKTAYWDRLRR